MSNARRFPFQTRSRVGNEGVFWSRWKSEHLQSLQTQSKWYYPTRDVKFGNAVIIKDENLTRNHWPLEIVHKVVPSSDGRICKVKLCISNTSLDKTGHPTKSTSYLERPVYKLVLLVETLEKDQGIPPPKSP